MSWQVIPGTAVTAVLSGIVPGGQGRGKEPM